MAKYFINNLGNVLPKLFNSESEAFTYATEELKLPSYQFRIGEKETTEEYLKRHSQSSSVKHLQRECQKHQVFKDSLLD